MINDALIRIKVTDTNAWLLGFLMLGLVGGCVHGNPRPPDGELAFPYGTYQHRVIATPVGKEKAADIELDGVVQSGPYDLRVVGLSPVGSTLFRIHEDLCERKITKEFYLDEIKAHEARLMPVYELIKQALYARKGENHFKRRGAEFTLSQVDSHGMPHLIEIVHPYLKMKIEVTNYAP